MAEESQEGMGNQQDNHRDMQRDKQRDRPISNVNLVRFADKPDVLSITPRKVFMPKISAFLCRETLLEEFSPLRVSHKSRDAERRHLSITSMQHDIENLRKYLGDQMKSKGLLAVGAFDSSHEVCKSLCGTKSYGSRCCEAMVGCFAVLLCIPCLLVTYCAKSFRSCNKPKINAQEIRSENVSAMEDFDFFWDPVDIADDEYEQYQNSVKPFYLDWIQTKNPLSGDKIDKELTEICINDYSNRFQVWLDLFATDGVYYYTDKTGHGLKILQIAYNNGSGNVIRQMIENGHINAEVRSAKFQCGLYKGTSPLHLAVINKCPIATGKLLDHGDSYELLNQRADSTPLREMFPTIELPLNLAVWVGDASIVTLLIERGAELCNCDQDGNNPMHVVALLAEKDAEKSLQMLDLLLELIDSWLENTTECKALLDLSLKKGRLVALNMLFKTPNKQALTPLKLAAKSGCATVVQRILSIDKLYRFPLYKLGPKSESLYDFSEIDPLLTHGENTASMLEILVYEENDIALEILGLPLIASLKNIKNKRLQLPTALVIIFHLLFMTLESVSFYVYLLPNMQDSAANSTLPSHRFNMHSVDIMVLIIACIYMMMFLLGSFSCIQMARRIHLSFWNISFVVGSMQLPTVGGFSGFLILYFILKSVGSDYEVFMLAFAMLFGWIHCLYFTRMFRSTSFFAIMLHRVLFEDVLRFLSIIGIMVLSFTMMTSAILTIDSAVTDPDNGKDVSATEPIAIAFEFFKLASGITDFTLLHESSNWFISGLIYIAFLVIANILMFNLLIASMSNRYALINGNQELLCTKVTLEDVLLWEWMMPKSMRESAKGIYEHRVVRVRLNSSHYLENHVYLLQAPDPEDNSMQLQLSRRRATIHY